MLPFVAGNLRIYLNRVNGLKQAVSKWRNSLAALLNNLSLDTCNTQKGFWSEHLHLYLIDDEDFVLD